MEDDSAFTYKKEKAASSVVCDLIFSHVGLFFVVALYTCLGAMAFVKLETPYENRQYEKKMAAANSINQTMNYVSQLLWFYQAEENMTFTNYTSLVNTDLYNLEHQIIDAVGNNKYDGTIEGWDADWTFAKALLFTMTIISTIGYGHISPSTFYGQMFCIVYALAGCPLLLLFLANVGDAMGNTLVYVYSRCCCRWCRSTRNLSEIPEGKTKRDLKLLIDDDVGNEEFMPTSQVTVPITINLVILCAYIVVGAMIFSNWENWTFTSACYFTFISISTIGYGDLYPKTAMVEDISEDFLKTMKMFTAVLYLLMGMAMLSMAVNLMQDQLIDKCRWLAREIGITKAPPQENADGKDGPKGNHNKNRRETVADVSVPVSLSPSAAPTRPVSSLSGLPGSAGY